MDVASHPSSATGSFRESSNADEIEAGTPGLPSASRWWLGLFTGVLAGYALFGKGFAYIGLPPLYVGEVALLTGLVALLWMRGWSSVLRMPLVHLMLLLIAWGALRTLPYLEEYGMNALRDAALAGYMLFAILTAAALVSRPELMGWMVRRYQAFAKLFLMTMPILWLVYQFARGSLPTWPWADVTVIDLQTGDIPVHLGGIAAFAICGFFRGRSVVWAVLLVLLVGMTGAVTRGGLVACLLAISIAGAMRANGPWLRRLMVVTLLVLVTLLIINPRIEVPGRDREYSVHQVTLNLMSVVGDHEDGDLDDTKQWRLDWWGKIVGYTLQGDYFWTGKGFGVNLANSDGFQVYEDDSLRSPHNGHLTFLARGGVPAFVLWIGIQAGWLYAMLNGYFKARQRGQPRWAMLFVFLGAYYAAIMFNAAFDVYLEGPMGALWCWGIVGCGLAAAWLHERRPEVFEPMQPTGAQV